MYRLIVLLACWMLSVSSAAWAVDVNMTSAQAERYHALTHQLRCLVCQNQSIASSNAGLASDLRDQVAHQIVAGQSNAEIKQYLVERYGQWVLYDPPFQWSTWLLWCGPFILLLIGLLLIYSLTRGRRDADAPVARSAVDRERLAAILSETSAARGDKGSRERDSDD